MAGLRERRSIDRRSPRVCTPKILLNGLRLSWVTIVVWCEIGTFFWSLRSCRWPDGALEPLEARDKQKSSHVLLIGDVQVHYPNDALSLIGRLRRFVYELSLKKSWSVANRLNPHAVIFLGDMLSSGRMHMSDEEYEQYITRFKTLFPQRSSVSVYYLPGNNDVGLGTSPAFTKSARRRYFNHFGAFNQEVSVRNHSFLLLDAPGLVEEDYQRAAKSLPYQDWTPLRNGPIEFVQSLAPGEHTQPVILLSHIPLFRPDSKSCGPLREKGTIRRGVGHGYQNTLGKQTTAFLLETLRPSAVFSADNRDYCDITHIIPPANHRSSAQERPVREVTVKSFAPAKNIRWPGFQLMSLVTPPILSSSSPDDFHPTTQTFADTPCFLPNQFGIYTSVYPSCIILTIVALIFSNLFRARAQRRLASLPPHIPLSPNRISPNNFNHAPYNPSHPGSPIPSSAPWSPFIPFTPVTPVTQPVSPRNPFPSSVRMANPNSLGAPTLRAAHPSSPGGTHSQLLSPATVFASSHMDESEHEGEDEDAMFPAQYLMRRDSHIDNGWANGDHHRDEDDAGASLFMPAPGTKAEARRRWSWGWSFVFRGRRRRMAIHAPDAEWLEGVRDLLWSTPGTRPGRRRSVAWGVMLDFAAVIWPALVVWAYIVKRMY
ncbi:hypothetical protein PLICRDRAFT_696224 [Plicaturopsis crispa FD-325 SS-3]|nr:hypothetical protein PLICRDRAFT_696224 [Plicaturopsis crispa FD-325 SS-3]